MSCSFLHPMEMLEIREDESDAWVLDLTNQLVSSSKHPVDFSVFCSCKLHQSQTKLRKRRNKKSFKGCRVTVTVKRRTTQNKNDHLTLIYYFTAAPHPKTCFCIWLSNQCYFLVSVVKIGRGQMLQRHHRVTQSPSNRKHLPP